MELAGARSPEKLQRLNGAPGTGTTVRIVDESYNYEGAPFSSAELTQHLEKNGLETRALFAAMPTQCPGFAHLGYRLGQFPNAKYMGHHSIHIGVHQDVGSRIWSMCWKRCAGSLSSIRNDECDIPYGQHSNLFKWKSLSGKLI